MHASNMNIHSVILLASFCSAYADSKLVLNSFHVFYLCIDVFATVC